MKVLVIGYNPFSMSNNGGKLFISLFSGFEKEELCQFYVYPRLPDGEYCTSYYQQTDSNLAKFVFQSNKKGNIISEVDGSLDNSAQSAENIKNNSKNRSLKLLCRDLLWTISKWNTKKFKKWMENEKPTCIFADTGDSTFLYKVSQKLSKKYKLPLFGYFSDDYYSIRAPKTNLIKRYQLWRLRKRIDSFVSSSEKIFCINDTLRDYLKSHVKGADKISFESIYMGNSVFFDGDDNVSDNKNLVFSYIGNLSYGRDENLLVIGKELNNYNIAHETTHKLRIYAKPKDKFVEECSKNPSIEYKGFIPGSQVHDAILSSDILIHTESFLPENIEYTRFSLSTKIADSLASGKCLLAYGPKEVASIVHLINNDCSPVASSIGELTEMLASLIEDESLRIKYGQKGKETANAIHNTGRNSAVLRKVLLCAGV